MKVNLDQCIERHRKELELLKQWAEEERKKAKDCYELEAIEEVAAEHFELIIQQCQE